MFGSNRCSAFFLASYFLLSVLTMAQNNISIIPLNLHWTPVIGQLEHVSVGPAGVWGVQKSGQVFYRDQSRGNDGSEGIGEWILVMQPGRKPLITYLKNVDVGGSTVWGVDNNGTVFIRVGVDEFNPTGCDWVEVPEKKMVQVSISPNGHVWATDNISCIYRRVGVTMDNKMGNRWEKLDGSLSQVSIGAAGLWGINGLGEVYYRKGTYNDPDTSGTGWGLIPGDLRLRSISSGDGKVWGVDEDEDVYYRSGMSFATPGGLKWIKLDGKMRQLDVWYGSAWGTGDSSGPNVFGRLTSEQLDLNVNR